MAKNKSWPTKRISQVSSKSQYSFKFHLTLSEQHILYGFASTNIKSNLPWQLVNYYTMKLGTVKGGNFSGITRELKHCFNASCESSQVVRTAALYFCSTVLGVSGSFLCEKDAIYTLLELVTLAWLSVEDQYISQVLALRW